MHVHASAAVAPTRAPPIRLGEPPWRIGDGVNNWEALSTDAASSRHDMIHSVQATGSQMHAEALRLGDLKLVSHPAGTDCSTTHAGWYPPPGLTWNYTRFTVSCDRPPATSEADLLRQCSVASPCLFNITSDPCEQYDLAEQRPGDVQRLQERMAAYRRTAVLPWVNFGYHDPRSDPALHGPVVLMRPRPTGGGPTAYQGVWKPWLSVEEDKHFYPTNYSGPGAPV